MKFVLSSLIVSISFALGFLPVAHAGLSPIRPAAAPFELYLRAAQTTAVANGHFSERGPVVFEKSKFIDADWDRVPELTQSDMQASFEIARDTKPFDDSFSTRTNKRRASWLYPDDGCFVRAVIAADAIEQLLSVKSAKIFAFGNLNVKTDNSPSGSVGWWYHVAAISKVKEAGVDKFYVHDPAINPKKPMEVHEWLKAMSAPDAEVAICSGDAYDPDSDCASGQKDSMGRAKSEAPGYLGAEWFQIERLGRDPVRELGDFPPWL